MFVMKNVIVLQEQLHLGDRTTILRLIPLGNEMSVVDGQTVQLPRTVIMRPLGLAIILETCSAATRPPLDIRPNHLTAD